MGRCGVLLAFAVLAACGSPLVAAPGDAGGDASSSVDSGRSYDDAFVDSGLDATDAGDAADAHDALPCTNTVLASGEIWPGRLASNGPSLYWVDSDLDGSVRTCGADGGNLRTMSGSPTGSPTPAIAANSTYVYWGIDEGLLQGCSIPNCTNNGPVVLATGISVFGLALDDANLWFTWQKTVGGSLSRCSLPTCSGGFSTVYTSTLELGRLATYGGWLYFTEEDSTSGAIVACNAADCAGTATTLATGLHWPGAIVADVSGAYWTELGATANSGRVMTTPLGGGTVTVLASGQASPFGITVDSTSVYWANEGGTIVTCGKQGCGGTPQVLAHACFGTPYGIVVDDASVYWSETSNLGGILEASK